MERRAIDDDDDRSVGQNKSRFETQHRVNALTHLIFLLKLIPLLGRSSELTLKVFRFDVYLSESDWHGRKSGLTARNGGERRRVIG